MGSVSSLNPGIAALLQTLTNAGSPLASSPQAVAALEQAPAADVVQLSTEAIQLQGIDALFGEPDTTASSSGLSPTDSLLSALYQNGASAGSTGPLTSLEQALANAAGSSQSSSSSSSTPSLADALASYAKNMQSDQLQSLFGIDPGAAGTPSYFG